MINNYNNFDEDTLKLMICTAYSMAQEKQNINEMLNHDIIKCRSMIENINDINELNNLKNNLRNMEMLSYKQNGFITNCKLLITHIDHKINNPNCSVLPIIRYITKLDEF
jgi:hypothetical protein